MHHGTVVAGPVVWQAQKELSGFPAVLSCGRDQIESVQWTFQSSLGSVVKVIKSSERHEFRGSSLIIYSVEEDDSGLYVCTDTARKLHALQLTVIGKLRKLSFTASYCNHSSALTLSVFQQGHVKPSKSLVNNMYCLFCTFNSTVSGCCSDAHCTN